jgi:hypothetical protein
LNAAENKIDKASFAQLVFGAAIMTDKARLLAGEPTEIHANLNLTAVASLDNLHRCLANPLSMSRKQSISHLLQKAAAAKADRRNRTSLLG